MCDGFLYLPMIKRARSIGRIYYPQEKSGIISPLIYFVLKTEFKKRSTYSMGLDSPVPPIWGSKLSSTMVSFTGRRRRSLVGKYHNQCWRTYRKLSPICSVNISTRERGMPRSRPRPRLHLQAGATTDFGAAFSESC